mgnify:CR=1 FL=1
MKITQRQLRRIIKEEKTRLAEQMTPADMGMAAAKSDDFQARMQQRHPRPDHGVFQKEYIEDIIREEIMDYLNTNDAEYLDPDEAKLIERTINAAANAAVMDLVEG